MLDERLEMQASEIVGGSGVLRELLPGLQPRRFRQDRLERAPVCEATPADLMRFMDRLAREALVSRNASREMLRILGWQQYLDQVPCYVKVNPYARELNMQPDVDAATLILLEP